MKFQRCFPAFPLRRPLLEQVKCHRSLLCYLEGRRFVKIFTSLSLPLGLPREVVVTCSGRILSSLCQCALPTGCLSVPVRTTGVYSCGTHEARELEIGTETYWRHIEDSFKFVHFDFQPCDFCVTCVILIHMPCGWQGSIRASSAKATGSNLGYHPYENTLVNDIYNWHKICVLLAQMYAYGNRYTVIIYMFWHDCQETSTHESSCREFDSWIWTEHGMRPENVGILTFGSRFVALRLRHRHQCNLQPLRVWVKKGLCP